MKRIFMLLTKTDKIVFWGFAINVVCALFVINLFALRYPDLPSTIPLFYSLPWGSPQLASLPQFAVLPFIILLIFFLNLTLTWHLHQSQIILKRSLSITAGLTGLLLAITAYKIVALFT